MNGFSAADMSTAAANGFRDGLAAQPAAAQEAVWELSKKVRTELDRASCPDAFMRIAVEAVMEHAAAPVAAAPVDPDHGHIDPSWSLHDRVEFALRDAGFDLDEAAFVAEAATAAKESTPAAPGIDLDALRDIANDLSHSAKVDDYETQQIEFIESIRDRLLTVIDVSPKGGHCTTCTCDPNMTPAIRFDLSPAMVEGEVRNHLIALGWTPPDGPKVGSQPVAWQTWNTVSRSWEQITHEAYDRWSVVDSVNHRALCIAPVQPTSAEVGS